MNEAARESEGMQSLKVKLIGLPKTQSLWGSNSTEHTTFLPLDFDYDVVNRSGAMHKCSSKIEMYECHRDLNDKLIYNYVKTNGAIDDCQDCQAIINKEKTREKQIKSITSIAGLNNYLEIGRSENGQYWGRAYEAGYYDVGSWDDWTELTQSMLHAWLGLTKSFAETLEQIKLSDAE